VARLPSPNDLAALLDLLNALDEQPAAGDLLSELSFFAVQSRYDDEIEIDQPDWQACFAAVEGLILENEGRIADH